MLYLIECDHGLIVFVSSHLLKCGFLRSFKAQGMKHCQYIHSHLDMHSGNEWSEVGKQPGRHKYPNPGIFES